MRRLAIAILLLVIGAPFLPSLVPFTLQPAEQRAPAAPPATLVPTAVRPQSALPTVMSTAPTARPAPTPTPRLVAVVRAGTGSLRSAPLDLGVGAYCVSWTVEPPPNLSISTCPFVLELLGPDGRPVAELARGEAPRTGARGETFVRAVTPGPHTVRAATDCAWTVQLDLP